LRAPAAPLSQWLGLPAAERAAARTIATVLGCPGSGARHGAKRSPPAPCLDLEPFPSVRALSRLRLDAGTLPLLPGTTQGFRRVPLPGISTDRRCVPRRSGMREVAGSCRGDQVARF